jgi:hypothetical protein
VRVSSIRGSLLVPVVRGSIPPASTNLIGYLHARFCFVPILVPIQAAVASPSGSVRGSGRRWGSCAARSGRSSGFEPAGPPFESGRARSEVQAVSLR